MSIYIIFIVLAIFLIISFYFDAKEMRLPNWLMVSGACAGLLLNTITNGLQGAKFSFYGLLVGFGILLFLHLFKAVGAGDVKLFGAIGAFVGTEIVLQGIMYSILYAGLIGVVILLVRRQFFQRMYYMLLRLLELRSTRKMSTMKEYKKEAMTFPFMYAVMPGMITAFYYISWL